MHRPWIPASYGIYVWPNLLSLNAWLPVFCWISLALEQKMPNGFLSQGETKSVYALSKAYTKFFP